MQKYTEPICEVINVSFLVNDGDPSYSSDEGTTGIVTSGQGISADMAQSNENSFFDGDEISTNHSNLWDD